MWRGLLVLLPLKVAVHVDLASPRLLIDHERGCRRRRRRREPGNLVKVRRRVVWVWVAGGALVRLLDAASCSGIAFFLGEKFLVNSTLLESHRSWLRLWKYFVAYLHYLLIYCEYDD